MSLLGSILLLHLIIYMNFVASCNGKSTVSSLAYTHTTPLETGTSSCCLQPSEYFFWYSPSRLEDWKSLENRVYLSSCLGVMHFMTLVTWFLLRGFLNLHTPHCLSFFLPPTHYLDWFSRVGLMGSSDCISLGPSPWRIDHFSIAGSLHTQHHC